MVIIQCREGSTRLKDKWDLPISPDGKRSVELLYRTCLAVDDVVVVAIPHDDVRLKAFLQSKHLEYCEGPEDDVLGRYIIAASLYRPDDCVIRVTADCPLLPEDMLHFMRCKHIDGGYDFSTNAYPPRTTPDGYDIEIMSLRALYWANLHAKDRQREHVTQVLYEEQLPPEFKVWRYRPHYDQSQLKISLDTQADYERIRSAYVE